MGQWDGQIDKLKQIIEIMKEHNLVEVQIKQGEDEICVKKGHSGAPGQPQIAGGPVIMPGVASQPQPPKEEKLAEIKSPLVGTFYAHPSPDSEPYIEVGSHVDAQTVVCIIEAMKVMNEIKAEVSGTIVEVVAISGEAVEYGQVLYRVRPD